MISLLLLAQLNGTCFLTNPNGDIIDLGELCGGGNAPEIQLQNENNSDTEKNNIFEKIPSAFISEYGKSFYYIIDFPEIYLYISMGGRIGYQLKKQYPDSIEYYDIVPTEFYDVGRFKGKPKKIYEYYITYYPDGSVKSFDKLFFSYYTTSGGKYIKSIGNISILYKNLGSGTPRITKIGNVTFFYKNLTYQQISSDYIFDIVPLIIDEYPF